MRTTEGVRDTLHDMWATRPARPRRGAKLAGVSVAIGARYGIDPVLIRVAFVVGVFAGGAGLALYLLGWLVLPPEQPQVGSSTRNALSIAGMVLLLLFFGPVALAWMNSAGLVAFLGALVALYLLHRNYRDRAVSASSGEQGNVWVYQGTEQSRAEAPPSWDPLGAAPFAWDEPAPSAEPEQPPKRHWITWTTLVLAVLAAAAAIYAGVDERVVPAVALGVLGLGMLAGAFLRGGRGLIAFALPVGAVALLIGTVQDLDRYAAEYDAQHRADLADAPAREVVVRAPGQLADSYEGGANPISLDLRGLRLTGEQPVSTSVRTGSGPIRVLVPAGADVDVRCESSSGPLNCLGSRSIGGGEVQVQQDGPGGGPVRLELSTSSGPVEVHRG